MENKPQIDLLAANIKLLVLDVDGILSDGKLYFANSGEEIKAFYTMDGLGLKMLMQEIGCLLSKTSFKE